MLITPNDYFDDIYCINLNQSVDRWKTVQERFRREKIHVTRFEGIEKSSVEQDFLQHKKNVPSTKIDKLGRYTVWRAFKRLFNHILDNTKAERILIFEDDILFHKDFAVLFDEKVRKLPVDWEFWQMGATQTRWVNIDLSKTKDFYKPNGFTFGMFGVALKRDFLKDYIDLYNQGIRFNDDFFCSIVERKNAYISYPYLIGHNTGWSINAGYLISDDLIARKPRLSYFKYDHDIYI